VYNIHGLLTIICSVSAKAIGRQLVFATPNIGSFVGRLIAKSKSGGFALQIPESNKFKITVIAAVTSFTLGVHYGWILEPLFGESHWVHAIHGRLCYIPIVIAASWFGLRGGLYTAAIISALVLPLVFGSSLGIHDMAGEITEIIFYFAVAVLTGGLIDREFFARRHQEEMRVQLERSRQLSKVGQIAAGVAHEIKNPLVSIKGAVEILSDESTLPAEKKEFSDILHSEIKRMDGTISDFLKFARPRETILKRMNLSESLKASIKQIETHASQVGVSINYDIDDDINVKGDEEKLHEMTLNILLNSIQVSDSDSMIAVDLKSIDKSRACLVFKDTGSGIAKEDIDRIFEPFYTTKPTGTGLGLAIVKSIIEDHRWTIDVNSEPNSGTCVEIILPLIEEAPTS
jgi:signal transduction histidine kinase